MSGLRKKVIEEHISRYYPNAQIRNYNGPDSDLRFYTAQQLQAVDEDWFPLSCHLDEATGQAVYGGRKNIIHTYTEGETGAGKTTRFVMQALRALSSMKRKPSFVIVDIHGEIIENLHSHFRENGYDIRILNCDDPQRSDTYNPFSELAEDCLKTNTISNDVMNQIRKIAEIIQPVESTKDPIWDQGARSYTNGCILDKFEDLIQGNIPKECLTIYNVIQNHYWLREQLPPNSGLFDIAHYRQKGPRVLSTQKMMSVTDNAEKTRASYFGVVENHYDTFGQHSLYALSSNSTIDISDLIEKPTVIVIQSGSTKIGDDLISLLMNEIYTYVVKVGKSSPTKKLPRNLHCFLDEFANCNIAEGTEYIKMLTTSRKFGMFWHMILQCDAQLDRKYDQYIGRIIRANSTEIFMGSHDYETEVRFAKSCGQTTIESLASIVAQERPSLETVDLMTPEKLNLTEDGYVYIKSNGYPLTKAFIEAFYNCPEFVPVADIDAVYPHNDFDYRQTEFYPSDLPQEISRVEYEVLSFIKRQERTVEALKQKFPGQNVEVVLDTLEHKRLIAQSATGAYSVVASKQYLAVYGLRQRLGLNRELFLPSSGDLDGLFDEDEDDIFDLDRSESAPGGPVFLAIQRHLTDEDVPRILERLEQLPYVPECLLEILRYLTLSPEEQKNYDIDPPPHARFIKFEFLEAVIRCYDFPEKSQWEEAMEQAYDTLAELNAFPELIMQAIADALKECREELTLENIREIKRIITDNG